MSRTKTILKKYGGAFGRFKAFLFVLGGVYCIAMLIQLFTGNVASDDFASVLKTIVVSIVVVMVVDVLVFLQTIKKAKQNGPVSPIVLLFDMLYVGIATDFAVCAIMLKPFISLFKIFVGGASNGTTQPESNFAKWYIRDDDNERFYMYNDCGVYAILASESANATTIEVWPHSNGYVHDNSGQIYRAM